MNYSIFIPVVSKDFVKLKHLVQSIKDNLTGYDDIHIVLPDLENTFKNSSEVERIGVIPLPISYHDEKDVLDMDMAACPYRPNWIYQQLLKMFQTVTQHEYFLTVDADVIFCKEFPVFTDSGKPILRSGWDQCHGPYFEFQQKMWGFGKVYPRTFITDTNFFNRGVLREIFARWDNDAHRFAAEAFKCMHRHCYMAEPELYGSWVTLNTPGSHDYRNVHYPRNAPAYHARHITSIDGQAYTDDEIRDIIQNAKVSGYEIIAAHSWFS